MRRFFSAVLLILIASGCGSVVSSEPDPLPAVGRQILFPQAHKPWRSIHCGMSCGMPHRKGFRVWFTGNRPGGFHICRADFDGEWNVLAESSGPCLEPGGRGEFDAAAVFMPCVIPAPDGSLRMYYAAHESGPFPGPESSTGLAVSHDGGETWIKQGQTLTATGEDSGGVGTHFVYREGAEWRMIYTSVTARPRMRYFLKFARSVDGLKWDRPPGNVSLDHDGGTSARPSVWKIGSRFLMAYTHHAAEGRGPNAYRIRWAESPDGSRFEDRGELVTIQAGSHWQSKMVCYPWVIPERGILLYTGDGFGKGGFGVCRLPPL